MFKLGAAILLDPVLPVSAIRMDNHSMATHFATNKIYPNYPQFDMKEPIINLNPPDKFTNLLQNLMYIYNRQMDYFSYAFKEHAHLEKDLHLLTASLSDMFDENTQDYLSDDKVKRFIASGFQEDVDRKFMAFAKNFLTSCNTEELQLDKDLKLLQSKLKDMSQSDTDLHDYSLAQRLEYRKMDLKETIQKLDFKDLWELAEKVKKFKILFQQVAGDESEKHQQEFQTLTSKYKLK